MNAMLKAYDIKYKLHKKPTVANMKKIKQEDIEKRFDELKEIRNF